MFYVEQNSLSLGRLGEKIAKDYLISGGYVVVAKNARISHMEIDLIVQKDTEIRFIEVKTSKLRPNIINITKPEDYLSQRKICILKQAIYEYCLILAKNESNIHLDLIAVTINFNNMANISHFKNVI
ncbi:MAG: YraN family protein [Candidatus Falkowbacteria bacterium]|nr:YraN family protein [Candidatus Falkowbacteria bacterium]